MKDIIEWQIDVEKKLGGFYRYAASVFREDKKIADFLNRLADDEFGHVRVMKDAAELIKDDPKYSPVITLDKTTKEKIEAPFNEKRKILSKGELSNEELVDFIVTMEFLELNDIFMYVVNSLKEWNREFMHIAAKMQKHKDGIEKFILSLPFGEKYMSRIRELPQVWQKKILVVEDSTLVIQMLSAIFKKEFIVDIAENGEEALKKVNEQYFDVIVSDINMPSLNGIDFYYRAAKQDPDIGERFLFFTGVINSKLADFFSANNLRNLQKPASIKKLRQTVVDIVQK